MAVEVSVIVPTYNRAGYLARALASIRAQTYKDYEIIVINDGGDDVRELCKLFGVDRRLAHDQNRGLPAARNTGIREAQGRMIAYLDDDDLWLPQHLEILTQYRARTTCRLVYSNSYFWQKEQRFELLLNEGYSRKKLLQYNLTPICSILHDKSLFLEAGYFDENLPAHEDYDMWLRMSEKTDFLHVEQVTALYSKRPGSDQISMKAFMADERRKVQAKYLVSD